MNIDRRVADQRTVRRPKRRVVAGRPDKGAFFPGEVARLLDIAEIDLQRLRRIFKLVRTQRGAPLPPKGEWARFDYVDIACTLEVVRICVDRDRLSDRDFRVALLYIRRACQRLQQMGLQNPLLQARLDLSGKQVVASIDGVTFDVHSGHRLFAEVVDLTSRFMESEHGERPDTELRRRIAEEQTHAARLSRGQFDAQIAPLSSPVTSEDA